MASNEKVQIKLQIPAGGAKPAPPVGPALGQHGLNIADFCKRYNDETASREKGQLLPVVITVNDDRTFSFEIKEPPMSALIKKAAGIDKGSSNPSNEFVATLTAEQVKSVAKAKMPDLNAVTLSAAMHIVAGSARSMGVKVEDFSAIQDDE